MKSVAATVVKLAFGAALVALPGAILAQENSPPSAPGEITVAEITAHSAVIAWGAATDPNGDALAYVVSLRKRIEGVAQPWSAPHDTRATHLLWDGLAASTVYDVKVVASDGKTMGPARIRELAFTTLPDAEGNHPPTTPKGLEATGVGPHWVKLAWGASTDADHDLITYIVSLRKRVEGVAQEWFPAGKTTNTFKAADGLEPETVYDARVRASDGKSLSAWFLKEQAFRTPPELNAPSRPGEITVSEITSSSAKISWGAATGPDGITLAYDVQIRSRLEGVAQPWQHAAETTNLSAVVKNLLPATTYDVQVRAWAKGVAGLWRVKENAFVTLPLSGINHPPTAPGPLEVSELAPFSVRLSWGHSIDPDGDRVTYAICLRSRIEGVAQPWSEPRRTERATMVWEELKPETVYEVRIRAWDGRLASDWYLKEHAFATPAVHKLGSFISPADSNAPDGRSAMLVVWPDGSNLDVLESSDSVGQWIQCLEIETDGVRNRALLPMDTNARFFRVR